MTVIRVSGQHKRKFTKVFEIWINPELTHEMKEKITGSRFSETTAFKLFHN